jgi:hypothetical protein
VLYAIKEYACTAIDVIARRTRLGFLNVQAADEALPRIVELMGKALNWTSDRKTVRGRKADLRSPTYILFPVWFPSTVDYKRGFQCLSNDPKCNTWLRGCSYSAGSCGIHDCRRASRSAGTGALHDNFMKNSHTHFKSKLGLEIFKQSQSEIKSFLGSPY